MRVTAIPAGVAIPYLISAYGTLRPLGFRPDAEREEIP